MIHPSTRILRGLPTVISILCLATAAAAGDDLQATVYADKGLSSEIAGEVEPVDRGEVWPLEAISTPGEASISLGGFFGYRFYSLDGNPAGVAPYEDIRSGPVGSFFFNRLGNGRNFKLDATFLNENDYLVETDLDYGGQYRLQLLTQSLHHNLEHLPLPFTGAFTLPTPFNRTYIAQDRDPGASYGIDTAVSLGHFRYRLPDYPMHLNLGIWQLTKDGTRQLRFADYPVNDGNNLFQLTTRSVESTTTELTASVDGHFGPVDAVYSFLYRDHDEKASAPRDFFASRTGGVPLYRQHNAQPDTSYAEHTVKLHSSLTGAVVTAASYSLGERKNSASLDDNPLPSHPRDSIQNGAADLHLTFSPALSLAIRFRHVDIDKDSPSQLPSGFLTANTVSVRPGIDLRREAATVSLLYRPVTSLTLKGEYAASYTKRDNVDDWQALESTTETHRGTLSFILKPLKGLRVRGSYAYSTTQDPSYGTSSDRRHDASVLATYVKTGKGLRWGGTLSGRYLDESNGRDYSSLGTPRTLPRERTLTTTNAVIWVTPSDSFSLSANIGYHRNDMDQQVIFESSNPVSLDDSRYLGDSQFAGLTLTHQLSLPLSLSAGYQYIRSRGSFEPDYRQFGPGRDTSGISDISRTDMTENIASFRAEYRFKSTVSCVVEYLFRDIDARDSTDLDGTVHRVTASLTSRW